MRTLSVCLFVLLLLLHTACSLQPILPETTSPVRIKATHNLNQSGWEAHLLLTRGRHTLEQRTPITLGDIEFDMRVPVGTWEVALTVYDELGTPRFQDKVSNVTIFPAERVNVEMRLLPADGKLILTLDLTGFPNPNVVLRSRIHLNDKVYEITRESASEALVFERSFTPGSYDMKVELFTESFRATDRIHAGLYQSITIMPSQEVAMRWNPEMETLDITAIVSILPEAPKNLSGSLSNGVVTLNWEASPTANIKGYIVYGQMDPFSKFVALNEEPLLALEFTHTVPETAALVIAYVVSAVSHNDMVGYRTGATHIRR